MSYFDSVKKLPDDPILGLSKAFKDDKRDQKCNLGVGAYKDDLGMSVVLDVVRQAETLLLEKKLDKEYPPIQGNPDFIQSALNLLYGPLNSEAIYAVQTLGGTGALRVAGDFLAGTTSKTVYLSDPTWGNHKHIFQKAGFDIEWYPYLDKKSNGLDFSGMRDKVNKMEPKSILLLQPCCHNPTGVDPTFAQWEELSELIKKRGVIPFFDIAYQGFGDGVVEDASVLRLFVEQGHELFCASSFSKNFGLYGERVGLLSFVASKKETADACGSQFKQIIRGSYSMPPLQGGRIVAAVLQSEKLTRQWEEELGKMRERINGMRDRLIGLLEENGAGEMFSFMQGQRGMFSFSGLTKEQVERLKSEYGIYMPKNGRINVAGLNQNNLDYVVRSICSVVRT